jgi:hypothetical protein
MGPLEIKLGDTSSAPDKSSAKTVSSVLPRNASESAPPFQPSASTAAPPFSSPAGAKSPADNKSISANQTQSQVLQAEQPPVGTIAPESAGFDRESGAASHLTSGSTYGGAKDDTGSFAAAWSAIREKLAAGRLDEALKDLTAWQDKPGMTPSEQEAVHRLLGELAGTVIYSRQHMLAEPHRVQAGERIEDIAAKHKVSAELLAKINGLDLSQPIALRPGQELKVVPGPFSAIVDLDAQRLILELDGRYAGSFPLAQIGATLAEKIGASADRVELSVTQKTLTPIYNSPQGEVEAGDPANPLGQHLLGLGNELALHGTNPKASAQVQQPATGIRIGAEDMAEIYDILTVGSRVIVRR